MPEDSYPYSMLKKGYRVARKYLGADDEDQPASTTVPTPPKPGKTRAQIAAEEAAMNKGTENLRPTQTTPAPSLGLSGKEAADESAQPTRKPAATVYTRSPRSLLQGAKDAALNKGTMEDDPDNPGKKRRKGFGLSTAGRMFLGGR